MLFRSIVRKALQVLINLEHRGACGCEANTGDGAGILIQIPDAFLRKSVAFELPDAGSYGVGLVFLPRDSRDRETMRNLVASIVEQEGARVLGWHDVPSDNALIGDSAKATQPVFQHVFIGVGFPVRTPEDRQRLERKLYVIRKRIEHAADSAPVSALEIGRAHV